MAWRLGRAEAAGPVQPQAPAWLPAEGRCEVNEQGVLLPPHPLSPLRGQWENKHFSFFISLLSANIILMIISL